VGAASCRDNDSKQKRFLGHDLENSDNLATIFSAVRRKLKVDIEVHTVKMAS
jgi:hypothetical protein